MIRPDFELTRKVFAVAAQDAIALAKGAGPRETVQAMMLAAACLAQRRGMSEEEVDQECANAMAQFRHMGRKV